VQPRNPSVNWSCLTAARAATVRWHIYVTADRDGEGRGDALRAAARLHRAPRLLMCHIFLVSKSAIPGRPPVSCPPSQNSALDVAYLAFDMPRPVCGRSPKTWVTSAVLLSQTGSTCSYRYAQILKLDDPTRHVLHISALTLSRPRNMMPGRISRAARINSSSKSYKLWSSRLVTNIAMLTQWW
jgi:hypothetical protein